VNSGHPLFFRASASCSKILNVKSIFHTVKNFWATLFFRASANCSKILNDKKCMLNTVKNIRVHSVFQGKRMHIAQNSWMWRAYSIQWKIAGHPLFFRASAGYSKLLNNKKDLLNTVKNIRATLFFRASASFSKILNVKSIFRTAKNFWATLFFRASASCSKFLNV